jgi:crotonobetainyl-CoA:carnitine CoA-transferase CaiB-like acyl-CoA transferase
MTTVFDGLSVVDFTTGMAGPLCGMVLADNGADVTKVEPPGGDWARRLPGFHMWNRGKKGVVLDLARDEDVDQALTLIGQCDVVIEDWLPHESPAALTYEQIGERHHQIVYVSIGGLDDEDLPAWLPPLEGLIAARSGRLLGLDAMSGSAHPDAARRPIFLASPIGSFAAAMLAVQGLSGALAQRERTGAGMRVDTSIIDGLVTATMRVPYKRAGSEVVGRTSDPASALLWKGVALTFMTAECNDGKYIQMCARQDDHFARWLEATGLGHLRVEPRFAKAPLRFESEADIEEMSGLLRMAMCTRTQDEWMDLFTNKYDIGADPVLEPTAFLAHPQMLENDRIVHLVSEEIGGVTQVGALASFSATPSVIRQPAPRLGQHQASLLAAGPPEDRAAPRAPADLPFHGVTIIEIASFLAGPLGTTLLAENGARVIKVEPLAGDSFRRVGLESAHLMHGKESIALDLKSPAGREILHRLVARADAVLNNYRFGVSERLGADYESLREVKPDLIYLFASSYGSKGPQARRPAFHSTPHALAGGAVLQAGVGNPPVDDSYPDPCAAIAVAAALAMGLLAKARYGIGQYIETSMLCSSGYVHSNELVEYDGRPPRSSVDHDQRGFNALYRLYPCAQGWLFLAVLDDEHWTALVRALADTEWTRGSEFATCAERTRHDAELTAALDKTLAGRTAHEWERLFLAHGVPAVVADRAQFEKYVLTHGLVEPATHALYGDYFRVRPRVRFSAAPNPRAPACLLGEHTEALLKEFGYSEDETIALVRNGVVAPAPSASAIGRE